MRWLLIKPKNLGLYYITICMVLIASCDTHHTHKPPNQIGNGTDKMSVVVRTGPSSWYEQLGTNKGIDHDLLQLFAAYKDKRLNVTFVDTPGQAFTALEKSKATLAVGTLVMPQKKANHFLSGPAYMSTKQIAICRYDSQYIKSTAQESMREIHIIDDPAQIESLSKIRRDNDDDDSSVWTINKNITTEDLISLIEHGVFNLAIVNSNEIDILKRYYPNIKETFAISKDLPISWILKPENDVLNQQVNDFFAEIKATRELENIIDRYYGHVNQLNYPEKLTFIKHFDKILPKYIGIFKEIGEVLSIDWRWLAAISYQESHWNPRARSQSGVIGLMMVTQDTIKRFNLKKRTDPVENALAGSYYFLEIMANLPDEIEEPDRTWMALVAYLEGAGYLRHSINLIRQYKKGKIMWVDVRDFLREKENFGSRKYDFNNPIKYVYNIRAYYDLIVWLDNERTSTDKLKKPMIKIKALPI